MKIENFYDNLNFLKEVNDWKIKVDSKQNSFLV